jgi:hypothetical protein
VQFQKVKRSATLIQAVYRFHARRCKAKAAADEADVAIQKAERVIAAEKAEDERVAAEAALCMQRVARGHLGRQMAKHCIRKIVFVQVNCSTVCTTVLPENLLLNVASSVPKFKLSRMSCPYTSCSLIYAQCVYRGNRVRCASDQQAQELCSRVVLTQQNSRPEMTLGNRTDDALTTLQTSLQLSGMIRACVTLDVATRWSKECSQRIVDEDAVHILLRLIRSCNRSTPHMELQKSTLNVLRNLCKDRDLCTEVFAVADSVDILVELMQMYRDKHETFLQACSILRHICKVHAQRQVRHPNSYQMLRVFRCSIVYVLVALSLVTLVANMFLFGAGDYQDDRCQETFGRHHGYHQLEIPTGV